MIGVFKKKAEQPTAKQEVYVGLQGREKTLGKRRQTHQENTEEAARAVQRDEVMSLMLEHRFKSFKEELIPICLKVFHIIETGETWPNSFYEATVNLIPKPQKDLPKKENNRPMSLMNMDAKMLNKILATLNPRTHKKII